MPLGVKLAVLKAKKKVMKKMKRKAWKKLSADEIRLATEWYKKGKGKAPSEIATLLGRDKSVLTRLLVKQVPRKKQGRPLGLTGSQVDFLVRRLDEMIVKANGRYHVTAAMLKRSARCKASVRVIQDALHKRKIYFRKMREKPLLTEEDVAARYKFAKKYKNKSAKWWWWTLQAIIDGKHYKPYLTGAARVMAAKHSTWGAYRSPGKGLRGGYVKPKRGLGTGKGPKALLVVAAACAKKGTLMWHVVETGRWSGDAAADMYDSLSKKLADTYQRQKSWTVLEDNDPTGFKSRKGQAAKEKLGIVPFEIPKRSPDLNVLDYAIWSEVNRRLRKQEKSWPASKRETRDQYRRRLSRTASRLSKKYVQKCIGDMQRRCQKLFEAEGSYFEEGGRRGC